MSPLFVRATWIIFTTQLRRTLFSGRALLCLLGAAVPLAVCFGLEFVIQEEGPPPPQAALLIGWLLLVQVLLPLTSLLLGSAAVSEEVEDRTLTYLVTRPFPRPAILVGRWLAALFLIELLLGVSGYVTSSWLTGLSGPGDGSFVLPDDFPERLTLTLLIGGVIYSALFAAAGAFLKRPVLMGLAYTVVFEGLAANAPLGTQKIALQYYLKSFLLGDDPELLDVLGRTLLRVELQEPAQALQVLLVVLGVVVVAASWRMSGKQFLLSD